MTICAAKPPCPVDATVSGATASRALCPPCERVAPLHDWNPDWSGLADLAAWSGANTATVWMAAGGGPFGPTKTMFALATEPLARATLARHAGGFFVLAALGSASSVHPVGRSPTASSFGSNAAAWVGVSVVVVVLAAGLVEVVV